MSLIPVLQLACLPMALLHIIDHIIVLKVFDSAPARGDTICPHTASAYTLTESARSNVSTTSVSYSKLVCCGWRRPSSHREDGGERPVALAEAILKSKWRNKDEDMVTKLIKVSLLAVTGPWLSSARVLLVLAT